MKIMRRFLLLLICSLSFGICWADKVPQNTSEEDKAIREILKQIEENKQNENLSPEGGSEETPSLEGILIDESYPTTSKTKPSTHQNKGFSPISNPKSLDGQTLRDEFAKDELVNSYLQPKKKKPTEAPKPPSAFAQQMEQFFNWVARGIKKLGNGLVILLAIFVAGVLIWSVYKLKFKEILIQKPTTLAVEMKTVETDIVAADFDKMIQNALASGDYRLAVRLLYGESLKTLTLNGYINWKPNKTNREYMAEMYRSPFREQFYDLTRRFEYVFYGEFPIDANSYQQTEQIFKQFRTNVKPQKTERA